MYWPNVTELKEFYHTTLGGVVRQQLRASMRAWWPDTLDKRVASKLNIAGIGYATPYLTPFLHAGHRTIALMPASQGACIWPAPGQHDFGNMACECRKAALPLADNSMELVMVVHALEYAERPMELLEEAWRVLSPQGRLLVVVPNRVSTWARSERSPFGAGHPYTQSQLKKVLNKAQFVVCRQETALMMPPMQSKFLLRMAGITLRGGKLISWCLQPIGGVLVVEAEKQLYAAMRPEREGKEAIEELGMFTPAASRVGK